MKQIIFLVLCVLQISTSSSEPNFKLEFLSSFIRSNRGNFNLHLPSWKNKERQALFKYSQRFLKAQFTASITKEQATNIYDLMEKNNSLGIPTDNTQKLLLISEDAQLDVVLKEVDALPGRNIFIARFVRANSNALVKLSRCYRLVEGPHSKIYEEYLLTWKTGETLGLNLATVKRKRVNFNGLNLPVGIVLNNAASLHRLQDFRDPWTDTYTKANYGPIMKLFAYYNISPDFHVVPDYKHLETIDKNKYLLTITAPYMSKNLLAHIDFLKVTPPTKFCFILRRPATSFMTTIFTVTFTSGVWYATLCLLAMLSAALYFFLNLETRRHDLKGKTSFNVYDLMLIGLEAICQQGTSTDPRSYASRILQVFMFMAFMFLYVAYSANILVLLQSTTALTNRKELFEYGVDFAGMNTSSFNYYTSLPVYCAIFLCFSVLFLTSFICRETGEFIFKQTVDAPKTYSVQEGMEKVRQGIFAFYQEARYGYLYVEKNFNDYEVCGLQELEAKYDFGLGHAAIRKDSGYTELFKIALLQITEQGFAHRHYMRYFQGPACYSQGSSFDTIGIREIYQAIVLVALGVVGGFLILALEIILFKAQERKLLPDLIK